MVLSLARWLRAAGYEVFTPSPGLPDDSIILQVKQTNALLITRDRILSKRAIIRDQTFLLYSNDLLSWIEELNVSGIVNWLKDPLSRCFECNGSIQLLEDLELAPDWTQQKFDELFQCKVCQKVYWKGRHYDQILSKLRNWSVHARECHRRSQGHLVSRDLNDFRNRRQIK